MCWARFFAKRRAKVYSRRLIDTSLGRSACRTTAPRRACTAWKSFPNIQRWYAALKERPALRRGMDVGRANINRTPQNDPTARAILFGIKD